MVRRREAAGSRLDGSGPWHVPKGGGAHGWASRECPHWLAGWCGREGLPDDPKRRAECPLHGWTQGSEGCRFFERVLLPRAPEAVHADYRWRTTPLPEPVEAGGVDDVAEAEAPRPCPGVGDEGCGAPLGYRRRLCDKCRAEARRRTKRDAQRRWRRRRPGQAAM